MSDRRCLRVWLVWSCEQKNAHNLRGTIERRVAPLVCGITWRQRSREVIFLHRTSSHFWLSPSIYEHWSTRSIHSPTSWHFWRNPDGRAHTAIQKPPILFANNTEGAFCTAVFPTLEHSEWTMGHVKIGPPIAVDVMFASKEVFFPPLLFFFLGWEILASFVVAKESRWWSPLSS